MAEEFNRDEIENGCIGCKHFIRLKTCGFCSVGVTNCEFEQADVVLETEVRPILVGDEVSVDGLHRTAIVIKQELIGYIIYFDTGDTMWYDGDFLTPTGKHYDKIEDLQLNSGIPNINSFRSAMGQGTRILQEENT